MNRKKNKPTCVFPVIKNGKPYRYFTRVIIRGKRIYLGCYKTQKEASAAYENFVEYCKMHPTFIGDHL